MAPPETTLPSTRRVRKSTSGSSPIKAMDKENVTLDMGSTSAASRLKSRSKSLGPGGLDALRATSGNRRVSLAAPTRPPPRSILKPTMPSLADIPPLKPKGKARARGTNATDATATKIALRTEEEQQAKAREREREEQDRAVREKEVHDHREARRKSLANRRVSFAAEATLHTFHEIEYLQDSTTSTNSTNNTTAAVATPSSAHDPFLGPAGLASPSTPPAKVEDSDALPLASPAGQRGMPQKKRRRSSLGGGFRNTDVDDDNNVTATAADHTLASTVFDSDDDDNDNEGEEEEVDDDNVVSDSGSSEDSDEGDGATMVTVDADEITSASVMSLLSTMSARSASPIESTSDLDEALRLATQHAGSHADNTRRQRPLDEDEELIPAFAGWGRKAASHQPEWQAEADGNDGNDDTAMSMDSTSVARGGILSTSKQPEANQVTQMDMSMDVTRVYGGILLPPPTVGTASDSVSVASSPMLMSEDDSTVTTVAPMGLRTAIGSIVEADDTASVDNEALEDMSMELTTVLGGVLGTGASSLFAASRQQQQQQGQERRRSRRLSRRQSVHEPARVSGDEEVGDETAMMDMTVSVGKILPTTSAEESLLSEDVTMGMEMDMTRTLGGILSAKAVEDAVPEESKTPVSSPPKTALTSETVSESPAVPSTPKRESPKQSKARRSPSKASPTKSPFRQNTATGMFGASVVLTPQQSGKPSLAQRRQSAFADNTGSASPKIAEIFSRRASLVDSAADFVVGSAQKNGSHAAVSFEEPVRSRQRKTLVTDDAAPADDREVTQSLKDMIQSLSPKKNGNPFKGRKSLHVGSARGLLGKRPFELDHDVDDDKGDDSHGSDNDADFESQAFVKRLKGASGEPSPVKNVRLQQPPSVMETIGRSSRTRQPNFSLSSSVPDGASAVPGSLESSADVVTTDNNSNSNTGTSSVDTGYDEATERIHLQEFLNLANIHFMELDTTKRRATEAAGVLRDDGSSDGPRLSTDEDGRPKDPETEALVTSVCKVPLLEMYQHACRELKNYIEEGRSIMREIEAATYEDNPAIFREYTTATPEMRAQMDHQFKNIKIFARLQSKKQWYEWRAKLHEGLQDGMAKTLRDLAADEEALAVQQAAIDAVHPPLQAIGTALAAEVKRVEAAVRQLGGPGREQLIEVRRATKQLRQTAENSTATTVELQAATVASRARVAAMKVEREQYLRELEEAKRLQEERRRWSDQEIRTLRAHVTYFEKKSGWAMTGAQGTTLSMTYRREIELVFDVATFRSGLHTGNTSNAQVDLWYIGAAGKDGHGSHMRLAIDFFLQCIRDQVRGLQQADTHPRTLLRQVRASWDTARATLHQLRHLALTFPTVVRRTSDRSLAVNVAVLLTALQTKLAVTVHLQAATEAGEKGKTGETSETALGVAVTSEVRVVYGEPFHAGKMGEFLAARLGRRVIVPGVDKPVTVAATAAGGRNGKQTGTSEVWVDVVEELKGKLLAQGRK